MDFFRQLFDTSDFPPRWTCGNWSPAHGWLHILSDLGVWSAYLAIPLVLIYFILRRKDLPFRKIFLLFGAFILACGTTHLMEAVIFWWPAYRLVGIIKLLTAIVSWVTVFALVPVVPRVLAMRSPEELGREIEARTKAEQALREANEDLEKRIQDRTAELAAANGILKREREWFQTTLASIGDAVIVTDTAGNVTFLNPVAQTLTGWTQDQAKQAPLETVFEIINEQSRLPVENPVNKILLEGKIVGLANHTLLIAKDGSERPIDDSAAPIRDERGNLRGMVLVFRDISARKQAEESLRQSEAQHRFLADVSAALVGSMQYRTILSQVAELTVPTLGDFCFFDVLGADEQLERVGWKHTDPTKADLWDRARSFVPSRDAKNHPIIQSLRTGQPEFTPQVTDELLQTVAVTAEHLDFLRSLHICSMFTVPMLVGERRLGALTFANSESRRHHTPGDLQLAAEVARRLALMIENAKLFNQLRDADQKKNEFLAVLAHELRNPLAPITNALELMRVSGGDSEQLGPLRDMMQRQVVQMTHLVDDLLDVSRITSGKIKLRKQPLDLSEVVSIALEASRPLVEGARHELTVTLPPQPLCVEGDKTRLSQVLSNLLANSAKYTPEGGHIWLTVSHDQHDAIIRVRDNGMGIPAEVLPLIFDMFTQSDRSLGRSQGGLGIGLALVRSLVAMHGGAVEANSEGPGRGSEFVVRLPLATSDPNVERTGAQPIASVQAKAAPVKQRVLVVDDNRDAAEMLSRLVKALGNEVQIAYDGPSALAAAVTFRPGLVLLDIGLPGMSGYDVARRMRLIPEVQNAVLVAQTGWGQDEDKRQSEQAGFNAHLVKPVDGAQLKKLLAGLPAVQD